MCSTQQGAAAYYGIAWTHDLAATASRLEAALYRGIAPTGGVGIRGTGCGPLSWSVTGDGRIGATTTFTLTNTVGLHGWAIGFPVNTPVAGCAGCTQGTSAVGVVLGPVYSFAIPANALFVGSTVALQGFDFAAGTCFGSLALSNAADLQLR